MNSGTFLPQELIDKFIDDLWFERDTKALKTLSRTSRLFLHRCRRHLFAHVRLSSIDYTAGHSQRIAKKAKNLDEILVKVPEIANYVQKLFFTLSEFDHAVVHIISQLLLRFSMVNEFRFHTPTRRDWTLVDQELQSAISRLVYSARMKTFSLYGVYNFPVSFFASCINITDLFIQWCAFEDHASFGNAEIGSVARLHNLHLCGENVGLEKLICASTSGQDGSPILDFSHLQKLTVALPKGLPALQEILKRACKLISLRLEVDEECSLNGVFQASSSIESFKSLSLSLFIDGLYSASEDPLFGLCHELRRIERSNRLEEIVIEVCTTFKLQDDFLADLNGVLTLPGYAKLRRLHLEILLGIKMVGEYDVEESRRQLKHAAQAQCSQLFHRPSLEFSYLVAAQGIDDDDEPSACFYHE